jgi:endonuclease/exonuclease/phosphatase family metal-dependent hydrolase
MRNTVAKTLVMAAIIAALAGCSVMDRNAKTADSVLLVSWNVQALFDGKDSGNEYAEYRAGSGWTGEKYRARVTAVADALKTLGRDFDPSGDFDPDGDFDTARKSGSPDIVAFIEIENEKVMEDIAAAADYRWTFFASSPGAALGLGLASRFPILDTKTHSAHFGGTETPRPVAEIWVDADGEALALMVCHWKSKLGSGAETEAARKSAAAIIARRLSEIQETAAGTPVIIMGDLNENADEFARTAYACALMPDSAEAAEHIRENGARPGFQDFLVISENRPPRTDYLDGVNAAAVLYSPWTEESESGSYYYRGQWETIDHFLFNGAAFDKSGWEFAGFRAVRGRPFSGEDGSPNAYVPRTGNGLSDHAPLLAWLSR